MKCEKGHIYDEEEYGDDCPVCWAISIQEYMVRLREINEQYFAEIAVLRQKLQKCNSVLSAIKQHLNEFDASADDGDRVIHGLGNILEEMKYETKIVP